MILLKTIPFQWDFFRKQGGDLGWLGRGSAVGNLYGKVFEDCALGLSVDEVSDCKPP